MGEDLGNNIIDSGQIVLHFLPMIKDYFVGFARAVGIFALVIIPIVLITLCIGLFAAYIS